MRVLKPRPLSVSHRWSVVIPSLAVLLAFGLTGCQKLGLKAPSWSFDKLMFRSQNPDDDEEEDEFETSIDIPMVGEYVTFSGLNRVVLEGVGLVHGLNGTGGNPPPSPYRDLLMDDMRRRNVKDAKELLQSPNTALVVVRAFLPPLVARGDRFDIQVRIPGDTGATSLNGGRLLETILAETAIVAGRGMMRGDNVAKARGPVLISTGEGSEDSLAGVVKRGRVLGGGLSLIDRDMALYVKSDFRTYRNITRLSEKIGERYFAYNEYGIQESLAKPQTDQRIILKIHPNYKNNYPRYLQVIQNIAFRETAVSRRVRMKILERDLLRPERAETAALKLEAIGKDAISILRTGLKSKNLEVRFHSALALAYLGESDGIAVLSEAALKERAFRVFSFASLSIIDDPQANLALRNLMSAQPGTDNKPYDSVETRYGAFRALWTLDERDPFLAGEKLNQEFWLHTLDTKGDPIVHLTHWSRAEVAIFGEDQQFRTPLALRAGDHITVNCKPGSDEVTVSRFLRNGTDLRKVVSPRIEDVIRAAASLGASYPDISQMLVQADRQKNLEGRFEIDALPQAGRVYYRNADQTEKARVGRTNQTPNMYERSRGEGEGETADGTEDGELTELDEELEAGDEAEPGVASLSDARTESEAKKKNPFSLGLFGKNSPDKKLYDPFALFKRKKE
jgi:hypothetical protein